MKIVIVDDDIFVSGALTTILEASGKVTVAASGTDGKEAAELYKIHQPDVLLMDIRMKEKSGLDASAEILEEFPDAKILLLTTFSDDEYIVKALKLGAKGYLLKQDYASILPALEAVCSGQTVFDIAKAINFRPGSEILDFGCGGGFPGIPLAILFPECKFKLIDGTGKKIKVCNEVASAIGLKNLVAEHLRGEDEKGKYDFVVSRAVMQLPDLMKIIKKNFKKAGQNALPNGLLCLKGGNLKEELKQYYKISEITPLSTFFDEEWFSQDKQLVYVPA